MPIRTRPIRRPIRCQLSAYRVIRAARNGKGMIDLSSVRTAIRGSVVGNSSVDDGDEQ